MAEVIEDDEELGICMFCDCPCFESDDNSTFNDEADQVVMLLPAATDTSWFHEAVWPHADLHYIRGRVRFLGWRGTAIKAPRAPSLVAVYRKASA